MEKNLKHHAIDVIFSIIISFLVNLIGLLQGISKDFLFISMIIVFFGLLISIKVEDIKNK